MGNIITEDNSRRSIDWQDDDKINIEKISSHKISELRSDSDSTLLIFPFDLDQYGDNIKNEVVCKIKDNNIHTGNIMGFVGVNDTQITIRSRFDSSQREDFFMHYMLQKVFSINIFDLKDSSSNESVFDFILYLFPYYLKKALRQGVFKQYQTKHFNDANIRGVINGNRHMSNNIPFAGKVEYRTREHSNDNHVTQLIRHTIEYIRDHKVGRNILQTDNYTKECVEIICDATTSYNRNNRDKILNGNNKSVSHPYFSSYTILQKLCKSILTHKGLKYGKKDNKIYGLLFDGAWLWEEYLFTILVSYGFRHPRNKMGKDHIYLFEKRN